MTLCLYDGSDVQREEKKAILKMLKELDSKTYLVITSCYYNRPNNPPMPVFIQKLEGKDSSCIYGFVLFDQKTGCWCGSVPVPPFFPMQMNT